MDKHISVLPTKLKYRMQACFCLMSILPILAGMYVASLFIHFPFDINPTNLTVISLVCVFSLTLSLLGFYIAKQMMTPLVGVSAAAHSIAQGKLDEEPAVAIDTADEIQDLTRSLKIISRNAKELLEKVEKLSLKDKLTGLYNTTYIRERLDEEIQRAIHYQRPCSFACIVIQNYEEFAVKNGEDSAEEVVKKVAQVFNGHTREFDRAARIGRGEFVVIFPDQNKKKCIGIVEKIAQEIAVLPLARSAAKPLAVCAGISENPMDGVQADELFIKAQDRVKMAKQNGKLLEAFA